MEYDVMLAVLKRVNAIRTPGDTEIYLKIDMDGAWNLGNEEQKCIYWGHSMNDLLNLLTTLKGEK